MTANPSLDDLIACAEREIRQRWRVYPRLVERGSMTQANADHEIACMEAIAAKMHAEKREKEPGLI